MSRQGTRRSRRATRVYFIGAGFSKPLGYPLGTELLFELVRRLRGDRKRDNELGKKEFQKSSRHLLRTLEDFLDRYMGYAIPLDKPVLSENLLRKALAAVNQTEFYSVLHALAEVPELFENRSLSQLQHASQKTELLNSADTFAAVAAATRTYFVDVCWTDPTDPSDMPAYFVDLFDEFQHEREAVITFNWDEEVETYIETVLASDRQIAYTRGSWSDNKPYLILKPHGSICWYDLKQGILPPNTDELYLVAGGDPRLTRQEMSLVTFYDYDVPLDINEEYHGPLACPPVITPPTFSKKFEYREQQLIWRDVVDVCADASEFVFLGYALRDDDYLTRAAVRRAILHPRSRLKYLVVNQPSNGSKAVPPHLASQFASVFGKCEDRHFLPWVFGKESRGESIRKAIDGRIGNAFV